MAAKRITDMLAASALAGSELFEVSQASTTVTITATTISALAADNSYNDSADGFVTAGFAVGDRVGVAGFTGDVANNILVGIITVLAAGKMTIGGTDGDVIVDDAAGESVTISKWESRRADIDDLAAYFASAAFDAVDARAAVPYNIGFFFTSTPTASEVLLLHTVTEACQLADDFAGTLGDVGTNPGSSFVADVAVNGSNVGTITISTGGVITLATTGGAVALAPGDQVRVTGPAVAVATLANVSITFIATRTY